MKMLKYALLLLPLTSLADITLLDKGQIAPYTGYLFDITSEEKNRLSLIDMDYFKQANESLNKQIVLYKEQQVLTQDQIKLWQDNSKRLTDELVMERNDSFWTKALWFGLGVLTTKLIYDEVRK